MNEKQPILLKITGLLGILIPIIAFFFLALSIYYAPWFSFTENWLSELAGIAGDTPIYAARGVASIIFNIGILIIGVLGVIFVLGLIKIKEIKKSRLGQIGSIILLIDLIALIGIGVFPLTTGIIHEIVSFIFFILIPIFSLIIGVVFYKSDKKTYGKIMIIFGILTFCILPLLLIPQPWGGNALIELIPGISISIISIIFGVNILNKKFSIEK